jgi:hypothetical protein
MVSAELNILLVRPWTKDTERLRTSIRAAGLSPQISRVDFPAAMYAALSWGTFDVVVYDPETPAITRDMLVNAIRERNLSLPIITTDDGDVGRLLAMQLSSLRN